MVVEEDNNNNNNDDFDCDKLCDKSISCNPVQESSKDDCMNGCEGVKEMLQPDALSAMKSCIEQCMPGDTDVTDQCIEEIQGACSPPPNLESFAVSICTWMIDCYPEIPAEQKDAAVEQCKAQILGGNEAPMFNCFEESALDALKDCVLAKTCDEKDTAFESCFESEFGIETGGGG